MTSLSLVPKPLQYAKECWCGQGVRNIYLLKTSLSMGLLKQERSDIERKDLSDPAFGTGCIFASFQPWEGGQHRGTC